LSIQLTLRVSGSGANAKRYGASRASHDFSDAMVKPAGIKIDCSEGVIFNVRSLEQGTKTAWGAHSSEGTSLPLGSMKYSMVRPPVHSV
jgi:hypothetical protein